MLVLEGKGAAADAAAFRGAGIGDFEVVQLRARRPSVRTGRRSRSRSRSRSQRDAKAPDIGYFTCQQHHPENFWNPAFQQHANGATEHRRRRHGRRKSGTDHRHFRQRVCRRERLSTSGANGIAVETPRGDIQVHGSCRLPRCISAPSRRTCRAARGLRRSALLVRDKTLRWHALASGGVAVSEHRRQRRRGARMRRIGATLIFEASKRG